MTPGQTERLSFEVWNPNNRQFATRLWTDPEVMRFLGGPYTEDEVSARLSREDEYQRTYGIQYWPLFLRNEGTFVGVCGSKPYDAAKRIFEIGFHLLPPFWGAGLALEASVAVIEYVPKLLAVDELFAGHHPDNAPSRRLLERLGFEQIGDHWFERTGRMHSWMRWPKRPRAAEEA
jgi:RimJ/RimL family protein N-acetyltransferase